MEFLGWYLLFACTTSLTALYELFIPILKEFAIVEPDDHLLQNLHITYFVLFISGLLLAPIFLFLVLVPQFSSWFRKTLLDTWTVSPAKI